MPAEHIHRGIESPAKRPKLEHQPRKFTSAAEIQAALRQNQDTLIESLTALRNQLTIRPGETTVSPQDERLLLAQHWLEVVPGAHDVFEIWKQTNERQTSLLALLVSTLSSLLNLLSSHYTFHSSGQHIIKTLLTPAYMRRLNSYLGGSHTDLILMTLKLLNAMSAFAGGRERKSVLEAVGWETKSLSKLVNMRRKAKTGDLFTPLEKPDIRTLYILFMLSFVDLGSSPATKTLFLEQHRDTFLFVFKGLVQDSYSVVRKVLEVCWGGIWSDPKIKRTLKIKLFNETTISQLARIYDRTLSDDDDPDHIPADLVHHFLLAICTRPGFGLCFKDRGWYPPSSDGDDKIADDELTKQKGGKVYNKILANILKTLKVNEDLRQQELALKIMSACPELVAGYWAGAALTLEPRLSSKWIGNISFFGTIISLPAPSPSFVMPNTTLYQPSPPPLATIMENILPSVNTKVYFPKGLQATSGLVQHCTAIALINCLSKYEQVREIFRHIETALEENEVDGQWSKRRGDVEREVRRRVPDFQVVVAFSQQRFGYGVSATGRPGAPPNPTKAALLSESAQRLLWLYQRCLPSVVAEARFDVGKLLQHFLPKSQVNADGDTDAQEGPSNTATRLHIVRQLHILRLLKDSDQFVWSGKMGSSSQTYLSVLMKTYTISELPATRRALTSLLQHILSESIMFQEDPDELQLWLISLPMTRRAPGAESPDGVSLTEEADSVIAFMDDCIQRCLKTTYRYIEELHSYHDQDLHRNSQGAANQLDLYPSPLLMTVVEQLDAKVGKRLLTPSDVLALVSFVRRLVFRLSSKQQDLYFLREFACKVDGILHTDRLFSEYPIVTSAIRREMDFLHISLQLVQDRVLPPPTHSISVHVEEFLTQIEKLPVPTSETARVTAAFELIDWLRLVDEPIGSDELHRLLTVIARFHESAIAEVLKYFYPAQASVWEVVLQFPALRKYFHFEWLFLHSTETQICNETCCDILVEAVFRTTPTLLDMKQTLRLIMLNLSGSQSRDDLMGGLLCLSASMLKRCKIVLPAADLNVLKEMIFVRPGIIKANLLSESLPDVIRKGFHQLVEILLDPTNHWDCLHAADISVHWLNYVKSSLDTNTQVHVALASVWIKYFESGDLFELLDLFAKSVDSMPDLSALGLLGAVLEAIRLSTAAGKATEPLLRRRLPQLLLLRTILPDPFIVDDLIATAVEASLPLYCNGSRLYSVTFQETDIVSVIQCSAMRWPRYRDALTIGREVGQFLTQDSWSQSTVKIICGLLYKQVFQADAFCSWLESEHCRRRSAEHLAVVMHAFLDTSTSLDLTCQKSDTWILHFSRLLKVAINDSFSQDLRAISSSCVSHMLSSIPSMFQQFLSLLLKEIQALPVSSLPIEFLSIGNRLHLRSPVDAKLLLEALVDHGIQWAVRRLSNEVDDTFDTRNLVELTSIVKVVSGIKIHLVETIMSVVIQRQLPHLDALRLVTALLSAVHLKPLVVNRHLQSIVQHSRFFKTCASSEKFREVITHLLHVMFHLHPANTCQVTHIEPLVRIYRGTLSASDRRLLSIFRLYELQRKTSIASLLSRWSSSQDLPAPTSLDAIRSLDPILVFRTCLVFPKWRYLEDLEDDLINEADHHDTQLYDPVFLILLFAQMLAENPPTSAFAWVGLFRTNIVSLLLRALSSKDDRMRDVALCQITAIWKHLQTADMQEKPHVLHVLALLKDVFPPPTEEAPRRLPAYITLTLLHALRGIFYPSNFIYPITARFLLQRPELDVNDVPMLYNMLYSSSDDWKKERGWIIRFLSDGMTSTEDWRVLKRRHTWDLLASLFQSSTSDRSLRSSIFEVLANLTCNTQATTSLVLKSALLAWIETQVLNSRETHSVEWVRILENIMAVVEPMKIESSTNGDWRIVICRCLTTLLEETGTSNTSAILPIAVPAILRLSLLPGPSVPGISVLLDRAVDCLKRLEAIVTIPQNVNSRTQQQVLSVPPHRAHGIHALGAGETPLYTWGESVESLWRVTMTLGDKPPTWDALTSRLLIWRAIVGREGSILGEWVRTEVVQNISHNID